MILQVKDNQNNNLGLISFSGSGQPQFIGASNKKFEQFVFDSLKSGATQIAATHDLENGIITKTEQTIAQNNPNFPLAFKQFLERNGYRVTIEHPEVAEEIKNLLAGFSDDNKDKIDIMKRLPEMSYLEQTVVLEGLEKIQTEHQ